MISAPQVDLDNARVAEQRAVMEKIIAAGECPFCLENLQRYHHQPLVMEGQHWVVTFNQWPYDHTKYHFLIIAREHITHIAEITPKMGAELFELITALEKQYELPGGALAIRFGDTLYSAGTVLHLHAQLVVPDATAPDFEPVRIKVGKTRRS